jgi:hypothetical protein
VKGLVEKLPRSRRYHLLAEGYSVCLIFLTDIPRIPDRCETRIVPSGVLSNGKSRTACAAGGQNRQLTAPRH